MPPDETENLEVQVNQKLEWVRRQENAWAPLFERMDEDWMLYQLKPFIPRRGDGIRREEAFTSNRPKVVADKLVGNISGAKRIIRTETDADNEEQRTQDENFERFGIGAIRLADRRREDKGGVPVLRELAFRAITQGGYVAARALLLKDDSGQTEVDVTPIHPRHLLIQFGVREPLKAAIVTMRDRGSIRDEYPEFKFEEEEEDDSHHVEKVVDYYWKEDGKYMNCVIVGARFAKKPTDTRAKRFPIVARAVGAHSGASGMMSLSEDSTDTVQIPGVRDFAESSFAAIRGINDFENLLMSFRMVNARKSVRAVNKVYSADGEKQLDDDIDENTTEVNLSTENDEEVTPMEVRELTRDVDSLSAFVDAMATDATLPAQSFGRIPGPLSGAALSILGQAEGQRLEPFIRPIESCLEGVIEALASQYETGFYKDLKVSGKTRDRRGFSRKVKPSDIKGHDSISVELTPVLPRDRQEEWLRAQLASQPGPNGMPLLSHHTIWDEILGLQDADFENERIFGQLARTSSPKTVLMTQLVAAAKQGDEATVQFLQKELERILNTEAMQDFAQKIAFLSTLMQNPLAAAASGMGQQSQAGGRNTQGTPPNPLGGISPELIGLSGLAPGSVAPSPEAGAQSQGPRSVEERANAIGITLAR